MNIDPNALYQPVVGSASPKPQQPFPNAPFPPPAVLTPQHQAILRALASQMPANPAPSMSAPAANPPQSATPAGWSPTPAQPRYQVVKHPSAPARLPYAIKDNQTGGYVTGGSPLFPRVFSTAAEAKAAIPTRPTVKAAPAPGATVPPPSAAPRFEVKMNPDAPARLQYGVFDNHAGDWMRNKFGFTQLYGTPVEAKENVPPVNPGVGSPLLNDANRPPASLNLAEIGLRLLSNNTIKPLSQPTQIMATVNSGEKVANQGIDPAHSPATKNSQFGQFVRTNVPYEYRNNPMAALSTYSQIGTFSKLQTAADQETLADTERTIQGLQAAGKSVSQHLLNERTRYKARVAWDPLIGTMPGETPNLWNCAVGTQQFLWAYGMPWDKIPHTESAGGMRSLVNSRKHDWQQVSYDKLQVGDLIFVPEPVKNHQGSGWHVCVYVGPGDLAIQADSGGHRGVKHYIRLAKYLRFKLNMKAHGDQVEYYHYTGSMDTSPHDVTKNAPWKTEKGQDKGNWQGYKSDF